jgi:hypothetical protein
MTDRLGLGTFINDESEVTTSSLDVFSVPPVDSVLKEGRTVYYYPTTSITNAGPYEFLIPRDPDHFICLPLTRLEGVLQVTKADGTAIPEASKLAIVNLFTQSIFKQVECEINGTEVCDLSTPTYAFKSYLETHLTYSKAAKSTHLYASHYTPDTIDKETAVDGSNTGAATRFARIKGKKCYFSNIIHSDFFQCQKLLIPNTEIKLKFIRNDDNFSFLGPAGEDCMITVNSLKLQIRKLKIDSGVQQSIESQLQTTPAIYNLTQSKIKTFQIPTATKSIDIPNIIQGYLPRSVHICFVSNDGFNGVITGNPFHFNNLTVDYFNLKINGVPICPTPFQPDFSTKNAIREYRWFLDNIGIQHENETNGITFDEFISNSCVWNFDLTPDLCNSYHLHETKAGSMDVNVSFKTQLAAPVYMLVYGCYNSSIAIDADRNVKVLN